MDINKQIEKEVGEYLDTQAVPPEILAKFEDVVYDNGLHDIMYHHNTYSMTCTLDMYNKVLNILHGTPPATCHELVNAINVIDTSTPFTAKMLPQHWAAVKVRNDEVAKMYNDYIEPKLMEIVRRVSDSEKAKGAIIKPGQEKNVSKKIKL